MHKLLIIITRLCFCISLTGGIKTTLLEWLCALYTIAVGDSFIPLNKYVLVYFVPDHFMH